MSDEEKIRKGKEDGYRPRYYEERNADGYIEAGYRFFNDRTGEQLTREQYLKAIGVKP